MLTARSALTCCSQSSVASPHWNIQYKEEHRYVVNNLSAGLYYYHQRHGLNSVRRRASECVELYLRFMYGAANAASGRIASNILSARVLCAVVYHLNM